MRILNYLFATYWFILFVLTIIGVYTPGTIEILCSMFIASLSFLNFAVNFRL